MRAGLTVQLGLNASDFAEFAMTYRASVRFQFIAENAKGICTIATPAA